jgi:D-glycero-alpha-D-manno-heptose 1-phosphate guanylyltransferase
MIPCVILAGGLGTRISKKFPGVPKALIPIGGKLFIDWKLAQLQQQGVKEVYLLTGVGGDQIFAHISRNYDQANLKFCFIPDGKIPLGTAGAIKSAENMLPDYFLLTFGDTLLEEEISNFATTEFLTNERNLLVATDNVGPSDQMNLYVEGTQVVDYSKNSKSKKMNYVDYGYALFSKSAFSEIGSGTFTDLSSVIALLIKNRNLGAHLTNAPYYEIGTPSGFLRTEEFLNLELKKRSISEDFSSGRV